MLHKCLSAFCPPLFSVPLVISPLAFLPFLRSSCGYLFWSSALFLLLSPLPRHYLSSASPLRVLFLLVGWGSYFHAVCSRSLQGFQRLIFFLLFALLLLPPLRVSLALPLRCPGLVRILVSLQFAPGFFSGLFSSSFLRCSCCLCCGSLCFPSASASSFIDFIGSTPLPGCAQAYAPLSGTSTTPSVLLSQCLVRVLLSFGRGLWLRSIPALWLRFLRLLFLTFACLRLRWCLP